MSDHLHPISVTDEYLAAILEEIRALRAELSKAVPLGDALVRLQEPETKKPAAKRTTRKAKAK